MTHNTGPKTKHFFIIFLIFSSLWDQGHQKRVRVSKSVALSICELQSQFQETGKIQEPLKSRPSAHSSVPCSWYKHPQCTTPDEPDSCAVVEKPCDAPKKGRSALGARAEPLKGPPEIRGDINDISTDVLEDEFDVKQGRFILGGLIASAIAGAIGLVGGVVAAGAAIVGGIIHNIIGIKQEVVQHVRSIIGDIFGRLIGAIGKIVGSLVAKIKWLIGIIFNALGQLLIAKDQLLRCLIKLICSAIDKLTDGKGIIFAIRGEIGKEIQPDVQYIADQIAAKQKTFIDRDLAKVCRKILDKIVAVKQRLIDAVTAKLNGLLEKLVNLKKDIIDAFTEKLKWLVSLIFDASGTLLITIYALVGAMMDIICAIIDKLLGLAGAFFNVKWGIIIFLKEALLQLASKIIALKGDLVKLAELIAGLIGALIESKWELIGMVGAKLEGCFEIECLSCTNCALCPHKPEFIKCKKSLGCGTFYNEDGTVDRGCFIRENKEPGCYDDFTKCNSCNPPPEKPGNTTYCKCNTDKCNAEDCGIDDGGPGDSDQGRILEDP